MAKVNSEQIWQVLVELKQDMGEVKGAQKAILVHAHNTDQHLNRLNERTNNAEVTGAKNSTSIARLYWIIGGLCTVLAIVIPILVT